jgi:hypothetical protein
LSPEGQTLEAFVRQHGVVSLAPEQEPEPSPEYRPSASCSVCGDEHHSVRPVTHDQLRPSMAPWLSHLCERCWRKYSREHAA